MNLLVFIFYFFAAVLSFNISQERAYQADADAKRIGDVHMIASLMEEYVEVTGMLPFAEDYDSSDLIHIVPIGSLDGMQSDRTTGTPFGFSLQNYHPTELLDALEAGLNRDLTIPVDPQRRPNGAPIVYYLALLPDGNWAVLAFLRSPHPHAIEVAPRVFAYGVASVSGLEFLSSWGMVWRTNADIPSDEWRQIMEEHQNASAKFGRYMPLEYDN